jgi:hypothetical protein
MSENGKPVVRQEEPPPRTGPRAEIKRLGPKETMLICVLSPRIWGFIVHWNEMEGRRGRTEPCIGELETCEGCKAKLPKKWLGYIFVVAQGRGPCFVELTPEAARLMRESLGTGETLRGVRGYLRRTEAKNGRLKWERSEYTENAERLPPDQDPLPLLQWLWSYQRQGK